MKTFLLLNCFLLLRWVTIAQNTITTGSLSTNALCGGDGVSVPYTATGSYIGGNTFTAQMSDAAGSFATPVILGSVSSTSSGIITGTIPLNITGSAYRVRVVSSSPAVTGSNNGSDLSVNVGAWTTKTPLNVARAGASAAVINNKLYVVDGNATNATEVYDPSAGIWTTKAADPIGIRAYGSSAAINGKLYVLGGCLGSDCRVGTTNNLEMYDPVADTWTTKASMPTARHQTAVGVINNKLYVAAGREACPPCVLVSALEVYDPALDSWTTLAPVPAALDGPGGAVVNGKFYVIGGSTSSNPVSSVYEYDPALDTWTTKASMPTARSLFGIGVINNVIYVVSGQDATSTIGVVEAYDPATDTWTTRSPIPTVRYGPAAAVIGNTMYVIGSGNGNANISTVEGFTPCTAQVSTWLGNTGDWNTSSNWSPASVPVATDNVAIASAAANTPVLSADASVNDMNMQSGSNVNLNGNTLTINGGVSGAGLLRGSISSSLALNGSTGALSFEPGYDSLYNVVLGPSATATLASGLSLFGTLTVNTGGILNTAGLLTLKSGLNNTAAVGASGGTITGNVTVERYIPANTAQAWRLLSVPVQGSQSFREGWQENQTPMQVGAIGLGTLLGHYTGVGFDYAANATVVSSLKTWNPATASWTGEIGTTTAPMQTKSGYLVFVKGDRSVNPYIGTSTTNATMLRTTGTLYQGNQAGATVNAGTYEAIGNLYASAIDFTALAKDAGIADVFYVWDPKLTGTYGLGAYQTFASATGWTPVPGGGSYPVGVPNKTIQSGQGFMVYANSTGSVSFTEGAKIAGNTSAVFTRNTAQPILSATLIIKGQKHPADGNSIIFGSGREETIPKLMNMDENFAIDVKGKPAAIVVKVAPPAEDNIVYNMSHLVTGLPYALEVKVNNFNGQQGYLQDAYLNTITPLNMEGVTAVNFAVDEQAASSASNRFSISFRKSPSSLAVTEAGSRIVVAPNPVSGRVVSLQFINEPAGKYGVSLSNSVGQVVYKAAIKHGGGSSIQKITLSKGNPTGIYTIEVLSLLGRRNQYKVYYYVR